MTKTFYRYERMLILLLICASLCIASGPDTGAPIAPPQSEDNWVYGKIEYLHDLRAPNEYFMLLRAHPGQPVPRITGGYATTDVYAVVLTYAVLIHPASCNMLRIGIAHMTGLRMSARNGTDLCGMSGI